MIERFLKPAILLINQLNYAKKFILVSFIFYVPLTVMSVLLLEQAYQSIATAATKVQAVNSVKAMYEVRRAAEDFRDVNAVLVAIGSVKAIDEQLKQQKAKTKKNLELVSEEVATEHEKFLVSMNIEGYQDQILSLIKSFDKASSQYGEVATVYQNHQSDIDKYDRTLKALMQTSGVSVDPDTEITTVLSFARETIPELLSLTGQIRTFAVFGIKMNYLNTETYDALDGGYLKLQQAAKSLADIYEQQVPAAMKTSDLDEQVKAVVSGVDEALVLIDEKIINASVLPADSGPIFNALSDQINKQHELIQYMLDRILIKLDIQKKTAEAYMLKVIVGIAIVLFITAYLYSGFFFSIRKSINKVIGGAEMMSNGDMTFDIHGDSNDEMGELIERFNQSAHKIRDLIRKVDASADNVHGLCERNQSLSAKANELISEQMDETSQVAVAVSQMTQTAQGVADYSQQAEEKVHSAKRIAQDGAHTVEQSLENISKLSQEITSSSDTINALAADSNKMAVVIDEIKSIAEQTNLLALNAAIEAARAGEQGRGFAVVADEVRSLSQRTHNSTSNIEQIIQQFLERTTQSVSSMEASLNMANKTVEEAQSISSALAGINNELDGVVSMNVQVTQSISQQADVSVEIDRNVTRIRDGAEQTAAQSNESAEASELMAKETSALKEALSHFRV